MLEIDSVLSSLGTSRDGISEEEAKKRLERYGPNELKEEKRTTPLEIFVNQFKSILVVILVVSAIVSAFISMREDEPLTDTVVILVIVVLNAILGFIQEYRAEQSVEALKRMVSPRAMVLRDGHEQSIESKNLVPGDIMLLEAGSRIAADSRLIEAAQFEVDEAALTGESQPISKKLGVVPTETGIGDRTNTVYMGTVITAGRGVAVVTNTGMTTEFGKIAGMVQLIEVTEPPLKKRIEKMGRQLGLISIISTVAVFFLGVFVRTTKLEEMFMIAISMAVSAIPEGLPAVLTITLALGTARMARQNAIVKKLASVETLGSTTVICSDKTGTLTKNEMTVSCVYSHSKSLNVLGTGYVPKGEFTFDGKNFDAKSDGNFELLLRIGALCNDAHIEAVCNNSQANGDSWNAFGDPTEIALVVAAAKADIWQEELKTSYPRVNEFPFDSTRKMMSTIHKTPEGSDLVAYIKGAPEIILDRSVNIYENGVARSLSEENRRQILSETFSMANDALRVLAIGYKVLRCTQELKIEEAESGFTFVGLVGIIDPPREEVPLAVKTCRQAGIRSVMVTGDHKLTAVAVAKKIGMLEDETPKSVFTGKDLSNMSDEQLDAVIEDVRVFARVSPEHKMRIAQSLKRKGHIVAMTGDGVNDAPALKAADIGIAMGIKGTDVTKEASDMILADDNFATIVNAVRGGRHVYDNITKYIRLMLAANFDEFIAIILAALMGIPIPFLPIHLLWINLMSDGLPAVALSIDPADPDLMRYKPRDPNESILSRFWRFILFAAILDLVSDFIPYLAIYYTTGSVVQARTVAFTCITFFEVLLAYQCRSESHHILKLGWKGFIANKMLAISVVITLALQISIIYVPFLNEIFHVVPLTSFQLLICFLGSITAFLIFPSKLIKRRPYAEG
ncbi:MAG: cation-transporting P-type ATPase [Candidatus Bathyarchaeota archaeon]